MTHPFGWSLPPGVSHQMIDDAMGGDAVTKPCPLCREPTEVDLEEDDPDEDGMIAEEVKGPNLCHLCGEWRCRECDQELEGNCPCQSEEKSE